MNRLIYIFLLLICQNTSAQNGYIRCVVDSEFRDKNIKVFRDEIFPYINTSNEKNINLIVDKDTITNLSLLSTAFEKISDVNISYDSLKNELIQLMNNGYIKVEASFIKPTDTVTLINDRGVKITQLINKREAQVHPDSLGNVFRLVISNSPTIFYTKNELKPYLPQRQDIDSKSVNLNTADSEVKSWPWWYYIILIFFVSGLSFGIWWWLIEKRKKLDSNEVFFDDESLSGFASKYGGLNKLHELNEKLIPTSKEWNKLKPFEKKKFLKKLKGKKIRIADEVNKFGFQEDSTKYSDTENKEQTEEYVEVQTNFESNYKDNTDVVLLQLNKLEQSIISEIKKSRISEDNYFEYNELQAYKIRLEGDLKQLEEDKVNYEKQIGQLQDEKNILKNNLDSALENKGKIEIELKSLKEKVIYLDSVKGYAVNVSSFLTFCRKIENDAYKFYNTIKDNNLEQEHIVIKLLMRYQNKVNNIPIGNWLNIINGIIDSGLTSNDQLIRSLSQTKDVDQKMFEFKRLLFSEVLSSYCSNIFILAESFRNLSRFLGENTSYNDFKVYDSYLSELLGKAKSIDIVIKNVSLFENFEKHLEVVESIDKERSFPYKLIQNLERGAIAEIVSVGIKTPFEDSKTVIIIA